MKLRKKLSLHIIPLMLIILFGFNILLYRIFSHYDENRTNSAVTDFLDENLRLLVEDMQSNRDYIQRFSTAVITFSSLYNAEIAVIDRHTNPVLSSTGYDIFKRYSINYDERHKEGLSRIQSRKSNKDTETLYAFRYRNKTLYAYIKHRTRSFDLTPLSRPIAGIIVLQVSMLLVMILILINTSIIKPINALGVMADNITGSNFSNDSPCNFQKDEFGILYEKMRIMSSRLKDAQGALLNKIRELENSNKLLNEAQSQLLSSERFSLVGKISSSIAHEIGNPLNGITGYIDLLKMGKHTKNEISEYLEGIELEICRIQNLIYSLLDSVSFRHSSAVEFNPFAEIVEIKDILLRSMEFRGKNMDIILKDDTDRDFTVCQYREFFRHVVFNLIHNALKFSPEQSQINIDISIEEMILKIAFRDYGMGINRENREELFSALSKNSSGTGLGLYLSRIFAEYMRGELSCQEPFGKGALFILSIPVHLKNGTNR